MKTSIAVLVLLTVLVALPAPAQDQPAPPKGKFSGLMFGDYFYNIAMNDRTKKDLNGFQFRRIYFTYDHVLAEKFDTRFRLEVDQAALTANGRFASFVKDAWLRWRNLIPNADFYFGIAPTPAFEVSEEIWAYRALEKTIMDLRGAVSPRDIGVDLRGKFTNDGTINYALKVGNNSGVTAESEKYKRYYANLWFKPNANVQATIYGDFEAAGRRRDAFRNEDVSSNRMTFAGFVGYRRDTDYALGLETFYKLFLNNYMPSGSTPVTALEDQTMIGMTAFAWYSLNESYRLVGRVDYFDPNTSIDKDGNLLFIAGLDYLAAPDVHVIPNLEMQAYQATGSTSDVVGRLTFSYNFR